MKLNQSEVDKRPPSDVDQGAAAGEHSESDHELDAPALEVLPAVLGVAPVGVDVVAFEHFLTLFDLRGMIKVSGNSHISDFP